VLQLLIVLTAVEIVLALGVLVVYLLLVLGSLRNSVRYAAKISFGVRAIETQTGHIGPAVTKLNATLAEVAEALPGIAERAEKVASSAGT
jgi:hypothetical protein